MLKASGAELCQNACGVVNKQKIFCSHQCSPECSMNKFRAYISTDTCFVLSRTHQFGLGYRTNYKYKMAKSEMISEINRSNYLRTYCEPATNNRNKA